MLSFLRALSAALFLLEQFTISLQVDISLAWIHQTYNERDPVTAICTNIPPGQCCKPHLQAILQGNEILSAYGHSDLAFTPLLLNQFGAGFAGTTPFYGGVRCSGIPIARIFGPSAYGAGYTGPPRGSSPNPTNLVFAAEWVNLRVPRPPSTIDLEFLKLQGVRGLKSGPDKWLTDSGAGKVGSGMPPWKRKRDSERILNSFASKGTAYIQAPTSWRYADTYNISGKVYHDAGGGIFESGNGSILNLTTSE
ncbi:MAG: hypothetical protein Q9225_002567 [Loekoesia sp. 1 TL-2023]